MMYKDKQKEPPSQIRYKRSMIQARSLRKWLDGAVKKKEID